MNKEQIKKVGFLLGSLTGAGAEKTVMTLATNMAEEGFHTDLYLLNDSGDYAIPENINIIILQGSKSNQKKQLMEYTTKGLYQLFVTSRAELYDDISTENKYCSVHITPTAWIDNPAWQKWKTWRKTRRLAKKFSNKKLIALSQGIKDDLVFNLNCRSKDITIINNPFDLSKIQSSAEIPGNIPNDDYIIYVASFIKRKRHADLLNAFSLLDNKSIKLLLLGKGELESEMKSLAKSLGILDRIIFWGWDENPYRLIKHAKVSILASEAEGLPRVVVESLALSTPVVSTDCPSGPKEVLVNELQSFLVPIGDIQRMSNAITTALKDYPTIQESITKRFDAKIIIAKYIELIH
jgi:glycosyltransferase involved in cell wall biosynthesis